MQRDTVRVMRIGTIPQGQRRASVYVKVAASDAEIFFTGVIGPLPSGNAIGGCGQIDMEFGHKDRKDDDFRYQYPISPADFNFAKGWNRNRWLDLLDDWKQHHMKSFTPELIERVKGYPDADRQPSWV